MASERSVHESTATAARRATTSRDTASISRISPQRTCTRKKAHYLYFTTIISGFFIYFISNILFRYPEGSQFSFVGENATDPRTWSNPGDVEFVYTSCDAINCWIEPRCTVSNVDASTGAVTLHQEDNSSCYHRLYYYAQCFANGKGPGRTGDRGVNPTHLENVEGNWSYPGQFYYDRKNALIGYIPRKGETVADLESTAVTSVTETILLVNGTSNLVWEGIHFEYATWLGASGPKGFVDTQSAYLCQEGEPPSNIALVNAQNISFNGCSFAHLGGVYALSALGATQGVVVSNSTFTDISGGGVKLGSAGERGAPSPPASTEPSEQDRGFVVSDCTFSDIPVEYSGANPIFVAYVRYLGKREWRREEEKRRREERREERGERSAVVR